MNVIEIIMGFMTAAAQMAGIVAAVLFVLMGIFDKETKR